MTNSYFFTSESVSEGHPDKICDQISDAMVDEFITCDAEARTAVETAVGPNFVCLLGENRVENKPDNNRVEEIVRNTIKNIGYETEGFDYRTVHIENRMHTQSVDIAMGVDAGDRASEGAGDQGIMFGYACNETKQYMPAAIQTSHDILKNLADARRSHLAGKLGPDAKTQVTLHYTDHKPDYIDTIVLSTQHADHLSQDDVRDIVIPEIKKVVPEKWLRDETRFLINPTGRFVIGGPVGDAGVTGRKIIVDTYGGAAPHGGGAFSGKDPTKVDRSAAYVARYLAKNIVAAGYADRCTLQLSYAIGVAEPVSIYVNGHHTLKVAEEAIIDSIRKNLDLTPRGMRNHLQLSKPIYLQSAAYGHFGRKPGADGSFSWERLDLVTALQNDLG